MLCHFFLHLEVVNIPQHVHAAREPQLVDKSCLSPAESKIHECESVNIVSFDCIYLKILYYNTDTKWVLLFYTFSSNEPSYIHIIIVIVK